MAEKTNTFLGIEFGSTRIKAVTVNERHETLSSGDYTWSSTCENGIWTYDLDEALKGLNAALSGIKDRENIVAAGISGMMHGYLAFDKDWNLLTPFRTWQNTVTAKAAERLTNLFKFNIPQRWSIAHLYQAIMNKEPHIKRLAHITTLAGYIHYLLTGVNAVGVGEASGIFPIDSESCDYDSEMMRKFDKIIADKPFKLSDLLPKVLKAGENAGTLTDGGAKLISGMLPAGVVFAPPEGDAGTGMTATNAVSPASGNVSAGTSIFSMVVLEKPLQRVYPEIDIVTTPTGRPVAMVHCNNCTNDMNMWVNMIDEAVRLFGAAPDKSELFTRLYEKSLEGAADCGGITVYNYLAGEGVTHLDEGRPMVVRRPDSAFTLADFLRAQLYSTMATLKIGMDILAGEDVRIERLMGHGGLFKTPGVGQRYMAAACGAPVSCMQTAGEGGPYGMAVLAAYRYNKADGETLEDYLENKVFSDAQAVTIRPEKADADGFAEYIGRFKRGLQVQKALTKLF